MPPSGLMRRLGICSTRRVPTWREYYLPFEAYITAGVFYLCLTFILVRLFKLAERRYLAYLAPRKH